MQLHGKDEDLKRRRKNEERRLKRKNRLDKQNYI